MNSTKKLIFIGVALVTLVAGAWAQTSPTATKPAPKRKRAVTTKAEPAVTAADVQALKDAIAAQQQQIQQLTQQLQQNRQSWQQSQQQVQQAQATAADAQQKAASIQASADQEQGTVTKLSSDVADVKTAVTSTAVASQEEQKRVSALESAFGRLRFTGDMRVRGEDYFQQGVLDRNRARVRARFGFEGQLNEDFVGGIFLASGTLGDPTTTNETLTGFFDRKTIGLDRAYINYNPVAHRWLTLTGGKFAFPWTRTSLTFDPDVNPEGFDAKVSFDTHKGPIRNFTAQSMLLLLNEVTKGPDTFAAGGSVSGTLQFGPWTLKPSYTLLNWHLADSLLSASAFNTQATTTGVGGTTPAGPFPISGEGPGCATVLNGSKYTAGFAPCAFAANGMTNSTFYDSKGVDHFLSQFLYSDFILNNQVKTGIARLPVNLMLEYEENLNAHANPFDAAGKATSLDKQNKGYGLDFSLGQALKKNDVQFGYSWWRIEQDAILASFGESDQRAPTNILQNRVYAMWKMQRNILAQYTMWFGRTLNSSLENNAATVNKTITAAGDKEPTLKRQQFDLVYTF
ncbi:MAG TPA: putative porin [Candidatus Sulfotelmatobacter sp.]